MRTNVFKQAILLRMQPALGGFLSIALLAGWSLSHQAPAGAAPLEIPTGQIATNEPELVSAIYVPGSVTVTVLPQAADLEEGQPTMVLCAIVEAEFALPGRTQTVTRKFPCAMTLSVPDLEKFPGALDLFNGNHCFDLYVTVEHENEEQGLKQIRRIYDGFVKQRSTVATEEVAEDEASGEAGSAEAGSAEAGSEEVGSEEEPTK